MNIIPVLKIGPILLVSIQSDLDDRSAQALQLAILEKIERTHAPALLLDVTALGLVDSFIARVLAETARMARIMNTKVVLVGMQPFVAATVTEMGLDFPDIETALDVERGLEALGYRLVQAEPDADGDAAARPSDDDAAYAHDTSRVEN